MKHNLLRRRKKEKGNSFRQFKTRIFFRTIMLVFIAMFCIYFLYSFFLFGRFADWVVSLIQHLFYIDYAEALNIYERIFRDNMEIMLIISVILVFFVSFRIYLNWFTAYFAEVNKGMDSLMKENAEDVSLSPELFPLERKMNTVKHTVAQQKKDILVGEQRKNDLIMYLAHDLKTPLASVIGYLNLLHDETGISKELQQKYLSISLRKAERLEDLINEFFEISKFNLSDITLQYSKINLTRLLEQLVFEFQPMLAEKELTCTLDAPENVMLRCDADKIQRVLDNLLRNAVIYSFQATRIEISVISAGDWLSVRFVNRGNTIPKDKLERIFEQYYRLDAARSSGSGGAGLGLAIAKKIVELHNGTIAAESENERIAFTVTLPIS